ncbi:MAG: 3'-5' exonuclease [Actinomycetota bacterium]
MTRPVIVVDTETTGLDPAIHEVVEVAWADLHGEDPAVSVRVPHVGLSADPAALSVNGYHERGLYEPPGAAEHLLLLGLREVLRDATLAGANLAFDLPFLTRLFGQAVWHYRALDIPAYVAGRLGWRTADSLVNTVTRLAETTGLQPPAGAQFHTAAGDVEVARWAYRTARGHDFVRDLNRTS